VRHDVDATLLREARVFALRFACEDCAHFDAPKRACTHGYIERPSPEDLAPGSATVAFCKEFELGGDRAESPRGSWPGAGEGP
jgi:hypothetical protein